MKAPTPAAVAGPTEVPPAESPGSWGAAGAWLLRVLTVISATALGLVLFLAVVHASDRYRLDHVSGSRIALARLFNEGTLYPELYDGTSFGGTRFMPLPLVLHGLVARLTDEYVVSGRVLNYAATIGLLVLVGALLRRMRCPLPLAVALTAVVVVTQTGLSGVMGLRGDVLPLLFQLSAVVLVANSKRRLATVGAAALAALALISKLSAVWAPLAILTWLAVRDRRRAAWFGGAYVSLAVALLLSFQLATEGRLYENVFGLATAGVTGLRSALLSPYRLANLIVEEALAAWALLPFAGLAVWRALRDRSASIYLMSLIFSVAVLLVVLMDVGTGSNQLLDVVVLTPLVGGELAGQAWKDRRAVSGLGIAIGSAVLWTTLTGLAVTIAPEVTAAVTEEDAWRKEPLAGVAGADGMLLAEDPYLPVSMGRDPVVLDPFMLLRIGERDPAAVEDLVDQIEAREFDMVALVVPLEPLDNPWWNEMHFGRGVVDAIARSYEYLDTVQGYSLYVPSRSSTGP